MTEEDAKLTNSDTPAPEVGISSFIDWLKEHIRHHHIDAARQIALADHLSSLMVSACADGQWHRVKTIKLVTGQAYVIRRPDTTDSQLATWNNGWRPIKGEIAKGFDLEVWVPNAKLSTPARNDCPACAGTLSGHSDFCPMLAVDGVSVQRLHALEALPEDIALIRDQNPLQRELHDGRPVVGWPKWAQDNLRSVIRYRVSITGGDLSAWEPRMG